MPENPPSNTAPAVREPGATGLRPRARLFKIAAMSTLISRGAGAVAALNLLSPTHARAHQMGVLHWHGPVWTPGSQATHGGRRGPVASSGPRPAPGGDQMTSLDFRKVAAM